MLSRSTLLYNDFLLPQAAGNYHSLCSYKSDDSG